MYKTYCRPFGECIDENTLEINYNRLWKLWIARITDFIITLMSNQILPVAVFDGNVGAHKVERARRSAKSEKVKAEMAQLYPQLYDWTSRKRYIDLMKRGYRLPRESYEFIPSLLRALGIPVLIANGEAETLCCLLWRHNIVDAVWSEDFDNIAYGCGFVIYGFVEDTKGQVVEYMDARHLYYSLQLTHEQFVEWYILCGCDYNEATLNLIGPAKALDWVKKYHYIENVPLDLVIKGRTRTTDDRYKLNAHVSRKIFLHTTMEETLTSYPLLSINNYISLDVLGNHLSDDQLMKMATYCGVLADLYPRWVREEEYKTPLPVLTTVNNVSLVSVSLDDLLN